MGRFASVNYDLDIDFTIWESCPDCTSGPQPGARALLAYWLEQFEPLATSMGIFNCRTIRGSTSLSIHACGRAVDMGVPVSVAGHNVAMEFLRRIGPHAKSLGVQLIIFSRTSGSARNPWPTVYRGVHPHEDHIHVELNVAASRELTLATLRDRLGDLRAVNDEPAPEPPAPEPSVDWTQEVIDAMDTVNLSRVRRNARGTYVSGASVKRLQSLLASAGFPPASSFNRRGEPDGVGGWHTRQALGNFQAARSTGSVSDPSAPDHIAGRATWTALLS